MEKPEPLFPAIAPCPVCGKQTRIKWDRGKRIPAEVEGLGLLRCYACKKRFLRIVGGEDAIGRVVRDIGLTMYEGEYGELHDESGAREISIDVVRLTDRVAYVELPD